MYVGMLEVLNWIPCCPSFQTTLGGRERNAHTGGRGNQRLVFNNVALAEEDLLSFFLEVGKQSLLH